MTEQLDNIRIKRETLAELTHQLNLLLRRLQMTNWDETLEELEKRIRADAFKLLVIGEFRRGKSTFINALLGQEILPAYAVPTTAIINEVKWGDPSRVVLHYYANDDGTVPEPLEISVDELDAYVTIKDNLGEKEAIHNSPYQRAEVFWPLELCRSGIEIIDSPGLNEHEVRQKITVDYLLKADAVLFVIACDMPVSKSEQDTIDNLIRGAGYEYIFFVCNRIDLIRQKERDAVKQRCVVLLRNRTKLGPSGIFFISARDALEGRLEKNDERVDNSGMDELEKELTDFLVNQRGRGKIMQPAHKLRAAIRDAHETRVEREQLLRTNLATLQQRYDKAQAQFNDLEQYRQQTVKRVENFNHDTAIQVRDATRLFYSEVADKIKGWVAEYQPNNRVGLLGAILSRSVAEALVQEVVEHISEKIAEEAAAWQQSTLQVLLNDRMGRLAVELDERTAKFVRQLTGLRLELTSGSSVAVSDEITKTGEISLVERVLSAVAGLVFLNPVAAGLGAAFGYQEMLRGLIPQIAIAVGAYILGVTNPWVIIPMMIAAALGQGMFKGDKLETQLKQQAAKDYEAKLRENRAELADQAADTVSEKLKRFQEALDKELGVELHNVRSQVESVLNEKRQGQTNVDIALAELKTISKELKTIEGKLDDIIAQTI